jgi:hypothetical protein
MWKAALYEEKEGGTYAAEPGAVLEIPLGTKTRVKGDRTVASAVLDPPVAVPACFRLALSYCGAPVQEALAGVTTAHRAMKEAAAAPPTAERAPAEIWSQLNPVSDRYVVQVRVCAPAEGGGVMVDRFAVQARLPGQTAPVSDTDRVRNI